MERNPAIYAARKAIEQPGAVGVGIYDLSRGIVAVRFPEVCAAERRAGPNGDGTYNRTPTSRGLTKRVIAHFCRLSGVTGPRAVDLWVEAIRMGMQEGDGTDNHLPHEALSALRVVERGLDSLPQVRVEMPLILVGVDQSEVTIE